MPGSTNTGPRILVSRLTARLTTMPSFQTISRLCLWVFECESLSFCCCGCRRCCARPSRICCSVQTHLWPIDETTFRLSRQSSQAGGLSLFSLRFACALPREQFGRSSQWPKRLFCPEMWNVLYLRAHFFWSSFLMYCRLTGHKDAEVRGKPVSHASQTAPSLTAPLMYAPTAAPCSFARGTLYNLRCPLLPRRMFVTFRFNVPRLTNGSSLCKRATFRPSATRAAMYANAAGFKSFHGPMARHHRQPLNRSKWQ